MLKQPGRPHGLRSHEHMELSTVDDFDDWRGGAEIAPIPRQHGHNPTGESAIPEHKAAADRCITQDQWLECWIARP